jgi:hypothetical protein
MKIISYTPLLYGMQYLYYAIKSVIDYVDQYYALYTPVGSHRSRVDEPCPESRDELYAIARAAAGNKLVWTEGEYAYEGQHRGMIDQLAPDADVIIALDADEIWSEGLVQKIIEDTCTMHRRRIRVPIVHFWRSFNKAIIHDPAYPERVVYPQIKENTEETYSEYGIAHMGYAQTPNIVRYKWSGIHGHQAELRKDCDWFKDIFLNKQRSTDLHPVGSEYWKYEHVNPLDYMPRWMQEHPFWGKEWVE